MQDDNYAFSPRRFGLPSREDLVAHRIWDLHDHGMGPPYTKSPVEQNEENFEFVERMGIERVCPFVHVGLNTVGGPERHTPEIERGYEAAFARWPARP